MWSDPHPVTYPDDLLRPPFSSVGKERALRVHRAMDEAVTAEGEARRAVASARDLPRPARARALPLAKANLFAARVTRTRAAATTASEVAPNRSAVVRALVVGAALTFDALPSPPVEPWIARSRTTVYLGPAPTLLLAYLANLPAAESRVRTLDMGLHWFLASPAAVAMARGVLLLPSEEQIALAYDVLHALPREAAPTAAPG